MRTLLALLTLLPAVAQAQSDETTAGFRSRAVAVVGGTVIPAPGEVIEEGVVLIEDGLVTAVGTKADVSVPPSAVEVDAAGMFVYAGWIEGGSAALLDTNKIPAPQAGRKVNFSRYVLAATRPDNRRHLSPEFHALEAVKTDSGSLDAYRKAGVTAVHVLPGGRIASGVGCLVQTGSAPLRERVLKDETVGHLQLKRFSGSGYPTTLMGTTAHLTQAILDGRRHALQKQFFDDGVTGVSRPPFDPALDAFEEIRTGARRVLFECEDRDDVERALRFAHLFSSDARSRVGLMGLTDASDALGMLGRHGEPVLLRIPDLTLPKIKPPKADAEKFAERYPLPQRAQREKLDQWHAKLRLPADLARRGIPFAISSDERKEPTDLLKYLRLAHRHGLPEADALAALTTSPAKWLGMGERLGRIEPGSLGNLTITTGPFLHEKAKIKSIVVEGELREIDKKAKSLGKQGRTRVALYAPRPGNAPGAVSGSDPAEPTELVADRLRTTRADGLSEPTGGDVLITNATLLTGTGAEMPSTSLLVTGGKIARIAKSITAPEGHTVIDGTGLYVMPGIIDTHSHIMITEGINEASQSITAEVSIANVIDTDDPSEFRALAGGVTTARILHGSANVIGGRHAVVKLKYGTSAQQHIIKDAPEGIKFALGENVKRNTSRFPNTRLGVEATLNRAFMEAADYRARWRDYERARRKNPGPLLPPRRDLRLEALANILDGETFIHCHCYRADEILMLLRTADSLGIRIWSLQHVLEGYKVAPEIAEHGASCSTFADWWAYKVEAFDATPFNAAALLEADINTCIKSDDWELIRHLYQEAAKPVRYGNVSPGDAIAMITRNPARELGLSDRIGTLEVGKDADLALFNGHPLNSFARCQMTLIEGEVYYDRRLQPTVMSAAMRERSADAGDLELAEDKVRQMRLDMQAAPSGKYLIMNATLHPVSEPANNGWLVIDNGRITGMGLATPVPADAKVIDANGLHVYPGLIDAGTTLGLTEIRAVDETSDNREGGELQPDLRAAVALNPDSELIPAARAGGITTIHVRPTSGLITGQTSVAVLAGWTAREMTVELEQGLQINWPGDNEGNRKKLDDFLTEAQRYLDAQAAAESDDDPLATPIADPRYDALAPYLAGEKPVFFEANTAADIAGAVEFAIERKLRPVITGGRDAWKVASLLKEHDVPVIVGEVMQAPADFDPQDAPYANPGRLHEAGVRFCIRSNDASNSRNAPFEAAMAVSHGLPADIGLRSVTLSAAEILGIADDYGSLEVGKRANLIITDGSPLQVTSQVKGVFIHGEPFAPESRQTRFYEKYRERVVGAGK